MLILRLKTKISSISLLLLLLGPSVLFAQTPQYPPAEQVAKDFKALLSRPVVDFKPSFTTIRDDSVKIEKGYIYTEETEKMPILIYKPVVKGHWCTSFSFQQ